MRGASILAAVLLAACGTDPGAAPPPGAAPAAAAQVYGNPRVEPGLVRWHRDEAAARAASAISGKPVLLFTMLGDLERELC